MLDLVSGATVLASHTDDQAIHLVLASPAGRYRLAIAPAASETEPLHYLVPADSHWELRRAAMSAFHEHVRLGQRARRPACLTPGSSERWRLVQWLRLLDALPEGVSARDLAIDLIARDARHYSAAEWDGSSERKRIARWHRQALALRDGGYRRLLNGN